MKALGGYFGLEFDNKEEFYPDLLRLNSARNALRLYLKEKKIQRIYVPHYICNSIIRAIQTENVKIKFYNITEDFEPVLPKEVGDEIHILYVNYFGICEDKIVSLKRIIKNIIVDNSQAFYSEPFSGTIAFYSPRKFFGVPDGGYLYSDIKKSIQLDQDYSYYRTLHHLIRLDAEPEIGYKEFCVNEELINKLDVKRMSNLTKKILCSIDYPKVKKIREENFFYLHERLHRFNRIAINQKSIKGPMVYPLILNKKNLRDELIKNRIYCGKYWKEVPCRTSENSVESRFAESIVALPIDQRFSIHDMKRIISTIEDFIVKN